ncbi:MAG TPA: LysE family transporter [Ferruginibacter sp.]|nr:LysE family transporter [Ferruginibacter sp.]HMP19895.1 LysE family transporter [Ferruginibacter sp.]
MIDALLKGAAISLLLIFSVGPIVFTIIKQSINNGTAGGFSFVAGVWLSDVFWVILSNVFSEIVIMLLNFKNEIGITGSLFLMGMGIFYLFFKKIHIREDENKIVVTARTHAKLIASGFLINSLNPAVIAFWLTTATAIAASHTVQQRIIIFGTCLLLNSSVDMLKVLLAEKIRTKLNEKNISLINKISGLILLAFGISLLAGVWYISNNPTG